MGFTLDTVVKRQRARARRPMTHIPWGWPHYSSKTGYCMCLEECCQDNTPEKGKGCICKSCKCRNGKGHPHGFAR